MPPMGFGPGADIFLKVALFSLLEAVGAPLSDLGLASVAGCEKCHFFSRTFLESRFVTNGSYHDYALAIHDAGAFCLRCETTQNSTGK